MNPCSHQYGLLCRFGTWVFCQILIWIEWIYFCFILEQILLQCLSDGVLNWTGYATWHRMRQSFLCCIKLTPMENGHLLQYENASCEYKKACGQGSKQFFLNAGQQKSIKWQLWKVFWTSWSFFFFSLLMFTFEVLQVYRVRLEYLKQCWRHTQKVFRPLLHYQWHQYTHTHIHFSSHLLFLCWIFFMDIIQILLISIHFSVYTIIYCLR